MVYYMDENAETQYKTIELEEITPGTVWNEVKDVNPELGGVRFQKKIKR